jgi:hypothetical protein
LLERTQHEIDAEEGEDTGNERKVISRKKRGHQGGRAGQGGNQPGDPRPTAHALQLATAITLLCGNDEAGPTDRSAAHLEVKGFEPIPPTHDSAGFDERPTDRVDPLVVGHGTFRPLRPRAAPGNRVGGEGPSPPRREPGLEPAAQPGERLKKVQDDRESPSF